MQRDREVLGERPHVAFELGLFEPLLPIVQIVLVNGLDLVHSRGRASLVKHSCLNVVERLILNFSSQTQVVASRFADYLSFLGIVLVSPTLSFLFGVSQ